ncbi:murein hydrolase activator EnvC family protein [Brachybacterium tyrofermentans]|uniref:murein hydrolase activator EnvC family protein n=1 Tax=Brachybacterium tyrofermentans TaxID=47848 RepID=UPI003FD45237
MGTRSHPDGPDAPRSLSDVPPRSSAACITFVPCRVVLCRAVLCRVESASASASAGLSRRKGRPDRPTGPAGRRACGPFLPRGCSSTVAPPDETRRVERTRMRSMTARPIPPRPPACPRPVLRALRVLLVVLCLLASFSLAGPARSEPTGRWQWPSPAPHEVAAPFEAPPHRYGPGHRGIDIRVSGEGAEIRAVEAGTVRFSGKVAGRGVVSVLHADGLISTYEPVAGSVEEAQTVGAGDVLGTVTDGEASHCPGEVCLHLGARRGQDYLDPLLLLGGIGPSVLLPWAGAATPSSSTAPAGVLAVRAAPSSARAPSTAHARPSASGPSSASAPSSTGSRANGPETTSSRGRTQPVLAA